MTYVECKLTQRRTSKRRDGGGERERERETSEERKERMSFTFITIY